MDPFLYSQMGDAMFVELPRVRLDGGARAFRQHWGYESRPLAPPPPLIEEDEAGIEPETVSLREANTASPIGEQTPLSPITLCLLLSNKMKMQSFRQTFELALFSFPFIYFFFFIHFSIKKKVQRTFSILFLTSTFSIES